MKTTGVFIVLFLLLAGCGTESGGNVPALKKAQDFTLPSVTGGPVQLSIAEEKPVLLVFWATWCPHCKAEIPTLKDIHNRYSGKDFSILAVSVDNNMEKLKEFVRENGIDYTVLFDNGTEIAKEYGVQGIPAHFIIDKENNSFFFGPDLDAAMAKADELITGAAPVSK